MRSLPVPPGAADRDVGTVTALEEAIARFDLPLSIAAAEDRAATENGSPPTASGPARSSRALSRRRARALPGRARPGGAGRGVREPLRLERELRRARQRSRDRAREARPLPLRRQGRPLADLFAGDWAEERRAAHVVARLAFVRELFAPEGGHVTLYRGLASERPLEPPRGASFVSATFDPAVAEAHFGGGPTTVAARSTARRCPSSGCS